MSPLRAEVISIGDEMTSGVRLDTNSQWLSSRLGELGIEVAFHSTVGDNLADNIDVFQHAVNRVEIVIVTGGLGPTADDLTRLAISKMADVPLVTRPEILAHIRSMFESRGREMPENNSIQAEFPAGAAAIPNPEGTAPGIDFPTQAPNGKACRIIALPGVPVEMKQMWFQSVEASLKKQTGNLSIIHHHTLHCFGSGESHIESLLPNLIQRGRDPQVGITASSATISLRVSTNGSTKADCMNKMQPTIDTIRQTLGPLVFGENGTELQQVVHNLLTTQKQKLAVIDAGLLGVVGQRLSQIPGSKKLICANETLEQMPEPDEIENIIESSGATLGIAIGPINRDSDLIRDGQSFYEVMIIEKPTSQQTQFRYSGHSGWREERAVKEVLNYLRLYLASQLTE
ncbi:molybdopterin-binding protein [Mariniblastus sp.]|nr:molybdopterin-binding protein [Mariniblastus sp.]MDB4368356.1 molybdopterin-binding protein [Mariniblastus sp.]MDB4374590.1 molybdopterin-binding protein [bacterium]MDC0294205.1 molybdopterin-binding protein [Mariniblastus sp.]MDC3224129.1 molybdopterin-binding protein [Mariniblastus sp.]